MTPPIKLAIFPGYFPPHIGGLETHVDEFTKYLSKRGFEVAVFTPNLPKSKPYEVVHGNVKVIRYPAREIATNYTLPKRRDGYKESIERLDRFKPDIIMTRTRFFNNTLQGYRYAKRRRLPLVHVEHGSDYVRTKNLFVTSAAYLYDKTIGRRIVRGADKAVAISGAVNEFLKRAFGREDAPIITRGVDFETYDRLEANRNIRKHYGDQVIITSVCRFTKWKGVENTIEAFKMLPEKTKKKATLLIAGYGEEEQKLKRLAGETMRIRFLGKARFEDAIRLLKTSDIFVHSSHPGGGLSNSLLQAMYCSCAVIASPHEGAKEVVDKECGVPLKDNSPRELQKAMRSLIEDKQRRKKLGRAAKRRIRERFDWEKITDEYDQLLRSMVRS